MPRCIRDQGLSPDDLSYDVEAIMRSLVAVPSVYPHEHDVADVLESLLLPLGFSVERVLTAGSRPNLVATYGSADDYLAFYGHMDTVPPAPGYGSTDPFAVRTEGDVAYGLGVCDMKGGLAVLVAAAARAVREKLPLKLLFGVDEEDVSRGAHDLVDSGAFADVGFLLVAESGQVTDVTRPVSVVIGRRGRLAFRVVVKGRGAHAAEAAGARNAVEDAATLVTALARARFPEDPRLGTTTLVAQAIESDSEGLSLPTTCSVRYSALTTPGVTFESIRSAADEAARAAGIDATTELIPRDTPYGDAYLTPVDHAFYRAMDEAVLGPLGVVPMFTGSVADENVFAGRLGIPVLSIGPVGGGDHTEREWVKRSSLHTATAVYLDAARLYAAARPRS